MADSRKFWGFMFIFLFIFVALAIVIYKADNNPVELSNTGLGMKNYIITFRRDTPDATIDQMINIIEKNGGKVYQTYNSLFKGFAAKVPTNFVQVLDKDSSILSIEEDQEDYYSLSKLP
ncbi:12397_t:CDS:2 [Entrophospora sp. SA101]|nr:141_t:CDS:2 [Entrophospora sp. SA101]CAJ0747748.1 12397_t:CDS:2 [Entrophospora sp. SA101]CAJ0843475.1 10089_t:CDS:2 [Entrophospora sp. SA101]CAJ0898677.1 2806_t:CDS:2 [Entrophospora sp. SA101]